MLFLLNLKRKLPHPHTFSFPFRILQQCYKVIHKLSLSTFHTILTSFYVRPILVYNLNNVVDWIFRQMATAGEVLRRNLTESFEVRDDSSSGVPELHVLAVDDSLVDRKVIERLLKISSCKGIDYRGSYKYCICFEKKENQKKIGFWLVFEAWFDLEYYLYAVTAVDSGTRALQYLGLDGEKASVGFDVRNISSDSAIFVFFFSLCLVAKKEWERKGKERKDLWPFLFSWFFSATQPNIQHLFFQWIIVITIAEGVLMIMITGFES